MMPWTCIIPLVIKWSSKWKMVDDYITKKHQISFGDMEVNLRHFKQVDEKKTFFDDVNTDWRCWQHQKSLRVCLQMESPVLIGKSRVYSTYTYIVKLRAMHVWLQHVWTLKC